MQPEPDADPNPLIALFRQCVVCVTDEAGQFRGSGFFVAPGKVVTCGHVAHGAVGLSVQWQARTAVVSRVAAEPPLDAVTDPKHYPLPDTALLTVDEASEWCHPCVALAGGQLMLDEARAGLYLAGYTIEHDPNVPALTGTTTEFESLVREDGHSFYKLKRGLVLPGFSGSPLLDLRSGLVAGIVESSRGIKADLGGFAVSAAELVGAFPGLAEANRAFHEANGWWKAAAEAERVRGAERSGRRGRLPLRPAVVPLLPDEDLSPAKILRPRHAVVSYVGREQLLDELATWSERESEDDHALGLWFVTGEGGFGKTRLAVEACREAEARGWTAGLLRPGTDKNDLRELAAWPGRLLVAVDYAETDPALIGRLADELAARGPRPAMRVMLLVRRRASRAELLELFNEQNEEQLDALLRRARVSRLEDAASEIDRLELFQQAMQDFEPFLGPRQTAGLRTPRLRAAHFSRPLYVLAGAYLARGSGRADVDALTETDLLRALLDQHEATHWNRIDQQRGLGLDPADQRAAVAVATLLTAHGEKEALAVARLVPHLGEEPESRLIAVARWLARLYPLPKQGRHLVIAPLEPDRLGEVLAGDVLREHPTLLAAAIGAASDTQLVRALTVAGRIALADEALNAQLRNVLDDRLPELFHRALNAVNGDLLFAVTTAMAVSRPARGALKTAAQFPDALPVELRHLAVAITAIAVDGLRVQSDTDRDTLPTLAGWLNNLANRLSDVGEREEALATAREGVTHFRQLAQANPTDYRPGLAKSLNNLATELGSAGEQDQALETAREAATLYRQLAQANPTDYRPGLATSLNNLANRLSNAGEQDEALATARESVTHFRQLAQANRAHLREFAASLNTLGLRLSEAGARDEALATARESVTLFREVAQVNPACLPDLAASLENLGIRLSEAGAWDEALATARETVTIRRELARVGPAAYLPRLAASLSNFAAHLSRAGERDEALATARESVTIRRQLTQDSAAIYLPGLAMSLNNLANYLSDVGDQSEALTTARQATTLFRQLSQANPGVHLAGLALSLDTLGSCLSEVGAPNEALAAAREATTLYRQLAQANPAAHLANLALSLNNVAGRLRDVGERDEALAAAREAATLYRQLHQANPAAYLPSLATSLSNLASHLSGKGERHSALESAREATAYRRQLAEANPTAHLPDLATSLSNLAPMLRDVDEHGDALQTAREALAIRLKLAQSRPAVYLPEAANSLHNLARFLEEAGQVDQADELFDDILGAFPEGSSGFGYILLTRGSWKAHRNGLEEAIPDLIAAVNAFDSDSNRVARGEARQALRAWRRTDSASFDRAWIRSNGPLPIWLRHLPDGQVAEKVVAWINCTNQDTSRAYLEANAADLLTDEAEAAVDHLIDANPAADQLQGHLELLQAARAQGTVAAYAAYQEELRARRLLQTMGEWLASRTWAASRAFAESHADELLDPTSMVILDNSCDREPATLVFRLHRGLLAYARMRGINAAYELLPDVKRQRAILTDPATPVATKLAIARIQSGQSADDPEAHFQLAVIALLASPDHDSRQTAHSLTREAAAAIADCAANAAPYEQRDFIRRLVQLGGGNPLLAPSVASLQKILSRSDDTSNG